MRRAPGLARDVTGLRGPVARREARQFSIQENEATRQIIRCAAGRLFVEPKERTQPHTRLGPMRLTPAASWIMRRQSKVNFIISRGDDVLDLDAVGERIGQAKRFGIGAE